MLKALELFGFKSFADRTRFDFPAGITVVVGPNGSGKSNIVDAIKWVLGEQSAKSLRGKDMADVIFKGSGTTGRKPLNTAEATLVIDNSDRRLPIDAPEVHVTRRVFRSGEGEYLINRQPARLKDIKDLFRGTGVGGDAYSLIEQGKVDRLLQASPKDRRAMFEEAAGISRFKAKKVEAQRRLERVDQNLLRLSDIVDEVESRLKSVRAQAGKAKRYREYSDRLQQLRTQVAMTDWRKLTGQLQARELELMELRQRGETAAAQAESLAASLLEIDANIVLAAEELRACEALAARNREQIAQRESTVEQQRSRAHELEEEASVQRVNLAAMSNRAGDLKQRLHDTRTEVAAAEELHRQVEQRLADHEQQVSQLTARYEGVRQEGESRRKAYVDQMQAAAVLASQVESLQTQLATAQQSITAFEQQVRDATAAAARLSAELQSNRRSEELLLAEIAFRQNDFEQAQAKLADARLLHAARVEDLGHLHGRRRGLLERAAVLEEFERTLEGFGTGVKEVLTRAQETKSEPLELLRGVVADLVQVDIEHASAIDAALGELSQCLVVAGSQADVERVAGEVRQVSGRIALIATAAAHGAVAHPVDASLAGDTAVVGRADQLVEMAGEYSAIKSQLLASTWVVRTLADAIRLHAFAECGVRFATLGGELIDASGAISLGPNQAATNLVSRRSELRSGRQDLLVIDQQIADAQREVNHLREEIETQDAAVRNLAEAGQFAAQSLADQRVRTRTLEERLQQNEDRTLAAAHSLGESQERCVALSRSLDGARNNLLEAQGAIAAMQVTIGAEQSRMAEIERDRQQAARAATAAKVDLAKSEQRLEGLRLRMSQFEDDQRERSRTISQVREQLRQSLERQATAALAILTATSELAELYLKKEHFAEQALASIQQRDTATGNRSKVADELHVLNKDIRKLEEQQHHVELAAEHVRHQRTTLVERLREDYGIELSELTVQPTAEEEQQRAAVEQEIESLRRKINQIGAVNLDALDELDELEARFGTLSGQFKDLNDAKQSLERIIHKINADSRRLFLETLEAIRVNFQALYRKAFGGGKADIVLEEGVDVLECGVEIIATPPGKPSFNNSLLSGGEKALTAVALLLAIFQFRPSPFCVLDEVDAPFDEANIGRFVDVLKDFLGWTKFIIVTHSKKTMTAATTLYGVTMQESGVSKRVSVRFEDVSEDGHIRREALDRDGSPPGETHAERGVA